MAKHIIGILDYGAGNTTSVRNTVSKLGFRSRLITDHSDFQSISLLLIPGVGAFATAMQALTKLNIVQSVKEYAQQGRGVIGVCLGMQLLADISHEQGLTSGLGLIPGEVKPIITPNWHIGWNTLETIAEDSVVSLSDGDSFYFNHAYEFQAPEEYVVGIARVDRPIVSVVKKDNVYGFQFHPEKSQIDGMKLMKNTIERLLNA